MRDYQESVTIGQTDAHTKYAGQCDPYVPLCFAGDTMNIKTCQKVDIRMEQKEIRTLLPKCC